MNESLSSVENLLLLHDADQEEAESGCYNTTNCSDSLEKSLKNNLYETTDKPNAVWTYNATLILLKLYENKLEMLETPKKKTRIWTAISQNLKEYNIEVTADQVRWKINALTKKYKHSVDTGQSIKFKYFKEMDDIHAKFNVDCDTFILGDLINRKRDYKQMGLTKVNVPFQITSEGKAMIELRKVRLANRIEADRTQSKLNLEKQWLEYLKKKEHNRLVQADILNRHLKLKEEELELHRQELEIKESMELRTSQVKEIHQKELLKIDKEKCEMLKQFIDNRHV